MKRWLLAALLVFVVAAMGYAAENKDAAKAESAVKDYEERIEQVAKEIEDIRDELEALTREMVEGETGRVLFFLKGKVSDWNDRGLELTLDGKTLFSRPLSPAELDVLGRGLPLELVEIRLPAGSHQVTLAEMGEKKPQSVEITVERAKINAWVAKSEGASLEWSAE